MNLIQIKDYPYDFSLEPYLWLYFGILDKYRVQPLQEFFEAIKVIPVATSFDLYAAEMARWPWPAHPLASSTC